MDNRRYCAHLKKYTLNFNYNYMKTDTKNKTTTLKSPIWWVWWKSKLSKEVISLFPKHKHYVEVFGGGLSIFFKKHPSKLETINDINSELINLYRIIKTKPKTLSDELNNMLISREIFNKIKIKEYKPKNNIERSAYFYYLISQSFWSKGDNFAMSTKSWRKPKSIYKSFFKWSKRFKFVVIENMSFEKIISKYDSDKTFFYLDPPYYDYEKYYKWGFKKSQHLLLRDSLKNIKWKFLLSYNDTPEIRKLYKKFNIIKSKEIDYTLWWSAHWKKKRVSELYISNYKTKKVD